MTNKEKARAYDAIVLAEKFNETFPIGSTVLLRKVSTDSFPYEEYKVKSKAQVVNNAHAVAFFEGISGYFSIEKDFIKYKD